MGLLLGVVTAHALPTFLFPEDAARVRFAAHLLPIVMASAACVVVTAACGMLPVLGTATDRPWMVLQGETGSPSKALLQTRSGLVIGQITACCMLVICTALLLAGLRSALKTSAGHRLGNPILLTVQAQPFGGPQVDTKYFSEVEQRTRSVRGLLPMAWMARVPGNQPTWRTFRVDRLSAQHRDVTMDVEWLNPVLIQTLDSVPVAGRMFGVTNQRYRVAVVDENAAAELYGKQTVGMVIRDEADLPVEIIGVVRKKSGEEQENGDKRPTIYYGYLNQAETPKPVKDVRFHVPLTAPAEGAQLNANVVSGNYFSALNEPVIAGEKFADAGVAGQGRVAVLNQDAADLYFNGHAVGAGVIDDQGLRTEIIGVVRSQAFGTFEQHAEPAIYFPMWQDCPPRMTLMLRESKWSKRMEVELRDLAESVAGRAPHPVGIETFDEQLTQSGLTALRVATLIGGVSAVMGLMLSLLGLLGAQSDAERQRQRDRALRIALGSQRWRIVLTVVTNAGRLALAGTLAGSLLSFAFMRVLLAGIASVSSPPLDVWLIAPIVPAAAVLIASLIPAQRASAVSPMTVLRDS